MAVPGFQAFLRPVFDQYSEGAEGRARGLRDVIAARLQLCASDLEETIPSGEPRFLNRLYWAHSYLKQAGLLESPRRGIYRMSPLGHQVKGKLPEQIDIKWLEQFPAFQDFRARSHSAKTEDGATAEPPQSSADELTPDEQIRQGYEQHRAAIAGELLGRIQSASPQFFEKLVIDLLVKMGYGGSRSDAAQVVGKSGDGGIDGVIKEDVLGLGSIYVQAKRWGSDSTVGRPDIQQFVGAVHGVQSAGKGVFITTSRFSEEARRYAAGMKNPVIILIDGPRLAELLIHYEVGIKVVDVVKLVRIDEDYLTEE
ncbi:MAG: restriction endonuclease [Steroidobacteraceae bacterium]|jgi:restriction system protein